jgi:hypothetical protein
VRVLGSAMSKLPVRIATIALLIGTSVALAAEAPPVPVVEAPTLRLPSDARPTRYAVTLTVVPGDATAQGEVAIDVELDRPHRLLWLNADSLKVTRAVVELPETRASVLSGHEQFVGIAFDPPLAAGKHRVTLALRGATEPELDARHLHAPG